VLVPEGADAPPETLATPKGSRAVKALDLGDFDIPLTALLAYRRAAEILSEVRPTCDLSWTLLAAIGRVESNHGRYAGATLDDEGVSTPRVVGVALNGNGPVAKIPDTDGGELDDDRTWDRAVGPMQFIPSTWEMVGVDGDGDGRRSIHDIDDAALAAGVYLCAGSSGLGEAAAMETALYRYNDSDSYVALVMAYDEAYRTGDFTIETAGGPLTAAAAALAGPTLGATPLPRSARPSDKVRARIAAQAREAVAEATKAGATTPGISATGRGSTSPSATATATPSETRSGQTAGGSPTPTTPGGEDADGTSAIPGGGTTAPGTSPEPSGGATDPATPSDPAPSEPAAEPSEVTPSESAPSAPSDPPSEPAPDSPSGDSPTTDPTPDACTTQSPDAATETPSPEPSADATPDPDDPCKPTESPSAATESPGP
jgi:hypothetical protein